MSDSRNDRDRRPVRDDSRDLYDDTSSVAPTNRRSLSSRGKVGLAAGILVILLAFIWIGQLTRRPNQQQPQQQVTLNNGGAFRAAPLVAPPSLPVPPPTPPAPHPNAPPAPTRHEETPAESPIFAFSGGGGGEAVPAAANSGRTAGPGRPPPPPPDNGLTARLHSSAEPPTRAALLPHPDFLITKGTVIQCILQTAINSELPGYVRCELPGAVRSTTGNVVLLDRGTTLVGELQQGLVNGQDRVFVLWDRAETPDHAVIALDSPAVDELGRSGLPGAVNDHFWKKFGAAIMLTFIQGGLQAGENYAAGAGSSNNSGTAAFYGSFQQNNQQLANTALQADINIPPTLEKNQGDVVGVFVARDLDFSDVYGLRNVAAGGR